MVGLAELGTPTGIRFSDVTDTSAMVHWMVPRARVDSYRVTYVPAHGGERWGRTAGCGTGGREVKGIAWETWHYIICV